jgi:methyl-accepting chemotaxis protein
MEQRGHAKEGRAIGGAFVVLAGLLAGTGWLLTVPAPVLVKGSAVGVCYAGLAAAYLWVRRLILRIGRLSLQLGSAAEQIAAAAAGLASANQMLSQTVSSQAESVSSVSGSSELMASIMRQSAETSQSAGELMVRAEGMAAQVTAGLETMILTIREAGAAAGRIAGVTRVVDELAFQTNILALNAAVEAARAGESGAGFAVVADEVRSLAQRSAEAARDIAALVEESAKKSGEGNSQLDIVAEAMRSLIEHTGRVKGLMDELAISNSELVRGTDQISESMRQLDATVQSAAASSEETAATGDELTAQAAAMRDLVRSLPGVSHRRE